MANMTNELGAEHAKDCADCMIDGKKTVAKLKKNFPNQVEKLNLAENHMVQAHALLTEVQSDLNNGVKK